MFFILFLLRKKEWEELLHFGDDMAEEHEIFLEKNS